MTYLNETYWTDNTSHHMHIEIKNNLTILFRGEYGLQNYVEVKHVSLLLVVILFMGPVMHE